MQRIKDHDAIEARLLALAHQTDAKLTAPTLAYYAPCSLEDAQAVLDVLATREAVTMEIQDDGSIVYELRGRQKLPPLAGGPVAPGAPGAPPPHMLAPISRVEPNASPLIAALLSLWIPGAGHLYAGRVLSAILWFLVVGAGYVLILPGLVLHLFSVASAANAARLADPPVRRMLGPAPG